MSGGQKEWTQIRRSLIESTLFAFDYISHICSRQHKHMPFLGELFKVFKGLNLQKEVGCNRSASLCKLIDKVVQLNEWEF